MMKSKILGITLFLLGATPVYASEIPIFTMPDVIIYANAENADTIVNAQQVNIGAAKTVPELLRTTAGIQIQERPNSGGNEDLTVKLRGHDSRHYTVLVDGVPHAMSGVMGGGYVNWNAIPLGMVERIEITKGAKSAAHGQTEGGTINIITKKATNAGELQITAGSNDRRQYNFNYGLQKDKLSLNMYANKAENDAYLRNSDYDNEQAGFNLAYSLNDTDTLRVNYDHQQLKRGLVVQNSPGENFDSRYPITPNGDNFANSPYDKDKVPGDGSYTKIFRNNFNVSWNSQRENGSDTITYWKNYEKQREHHVLTNGTLFFDRYNVTDKSDGLMYKGNTKVNDKHYLGYGVDYNRLRYGYGWYNVKIGGGDLYPSQKMDLLGAYVEDNWKMDDRWTTNIGLRYDKAEGDKDANVPGNKTGSMNEKALAPKLNVHFKNDERTSTSFSINRIWRAPSMAEFYWHYAGSNLGPANFSHTQPLSPEKGWGYEASVARKFNAKLYSKATVFYQDIKDYLNFTHQRPFNAYNIDKAQLWGFELENTWQLDEASNVFLNYTNLHTKKDGTDARDKVGLQGELDYRPRHTLALGYQYDNEKWHARYDMTYTSEQKATLGYPATDPSQPYSVQKIGGYVVHNVSATYDFTQNSSLNFSIYNLFDKNYCKIYGYPMEGRVFTATLTYKF